mmetsp:Transcript_19005/g.48331  ORF Transcript_19005/g.48331 Transcript_19005/m.48331 type:complete len:346 (+) Transcript_19005:195-1232(+)
MVDRRPSFFLRDLWRVMAVSAESARLPRVCASSVRASGSAADAPRLLHAREWERDELWLLAPERGSFFLLCLLFLRSVRSGSAGLPAVPPRLPSFGSAERPVALPGDVASTSPLAQHTRCSPSVHSARLWVVVSLGLLRPVGLLLELPPGGLLLELPHARADGDAACWSARPSQRAVEFRLSGFLRALLPPPVLVDRSVAQRAGEGDSCSVGAAAGAGSGMQSSAPGPAGVDMHSVWERVWEREGGAMHFAHAAISSGSMPRTFWKSSFWMAQMRLDEVELARRSMSRGCSRNASTHASKAPWTAARSARHRRTHSGRTPSHGSSASSCVVCASQAARWSIIRCT